jgi:predicted ATPase/class 3 adenylate cyclase
VSFPTGTVTLLFTDIEGSTRLVQERGAAWPALLAEHHRALREAIGAHGGVVVDVQGDGFFVAFAEAPEAVAAAIDAQHALARLEGVRVRMGLHTGRPRLVEELGYVGEDVYRAARVANAGHGGQVLLSEATRELVPRVEARDLGEHRLRDLTQPQRLFQLELPDLPDSFPPLRTLENRPTNLPVQSTALIGRERELSAVVGLIRRPEVRLVTLHGPGGCGKTRLAIQAAAELVDDFADGVYLVALESVEDPALVVPTIAQTLGVNETGSQGLDDALFQALTERAVLLVLDNFEHLLPAAPRLSDLLATTDVHLVVTSRAALRLSGEYEWPVPPLALPPPSVRGAEALAQYDAVALFVDRARAVDGDFALTDENAGAVAEICVRLDGLPLAIELAAARIRLLPPDAILDRLQERFSLLTSGPRDLPSRQQTLSGAIDWSYDLLAPSEQQLFARLSVFAGGCLLEAAEEVCEAGLDDLEALLQNNLLRQEDRPTGDRRFRMLETIREYAGAHLDELGEREELRRRLAEWVLQTAEERRIARREATLVGGWEREGDEYENIRAALAWARDAGETELELRLCTAVAAYWGISGYLSEGRTWLEDALARGEDAPPLVRARALLACSGLPWRQADPATSDRYATAAYEVFTAQGEHRGAAEALMARAIAAEQAGDVEAESRLHDEAEAIFRGMGLERPLASILNNRAYAAIVQRQWDRARELLIEALDIFTRLGGPWWLPLLNLGLLDCLVGDVDDAERQFRDALRAGTQSSERETVYYALEGLGCVHAMRRDDLEAARLWGASDALRESAGAKLQAAERDLHTRLAAEARERAGDEFERAWAEGRSLSYESAVALALE